MMHILYILILFALITVIGCNDTNAGSPRPIRDIAATNKGLVKPIGTIERVWSDDDVTVANRKGIRIHAKLRFSNLQYFQCTVAAYFYLDTNEPLRDINNNYCTTDHQVAVAETVTTEYVGATSEDFTLFMPYEELHVQSGTKLKFILRFYDTDLRIFSVHNGYYYEFTIPK